MPSRDTVQAKVSKNRKTTGVMTSPFGIRFSWSCSVEFLRVKSRGLVVPSLTQLVPSHDKTVLFACVCCVSIQNVQMFVHACKMELIAQNNQRPLGNTSCSGPKTPKGCDLTNWQLGCNGFFFFFVGANEKPLEKHVSVMLANQCIIPGDMSC